MDIILAAWDRYLLTPYVYPDSWPEEDIARQYISLALITYLGGLAVYFIPSGLAYIFMFDKRLRKHPLFIKNQEWLEIRHALSSIPLMTILTAVIFVFEVRGYTKLYDSYDETRYGVWTIIPSIASFLFFTDFCIYWIHRGLHHRLFYRRFHKPHHQWKVTTPFSSHAFNPVDGFLQSLPYHIYAFLFPLHKWTYLVLFIFVNIWSTSIHDGNFKVPGLLKPIINGSAHHTDHHLFYNYNYGQYFTLWDRIGGSFREPSAFEGKAPIVDVIRLLEQSAAGESPSNARQTDKEAIGRAKGD